MEHYINIINQGDLENVIVLAYSIWEPEAYTNTDCLGYNEEPKINKKTKEDIKI